jgi:tRNA pseudouridine32 synthase / 23S rRNA pseudouridine746 synthase
MTPPPSTLAAFGLCADCKTVHTLPVGNSRQYALELMRLMDEHGRIDFPRQQDNPPRPAGTPPPEEATDRECFDPQPSTARLSRSTDCLWSDARGQMFGVLECEDADGNTVVLKAFSGQYNGRWRVDGWVPPVIDVDDFYRLVDPVDREIKELDRRIAETGEPDWIRRRKERSRKLMKALHALYHLTNFRGDTRPLPRIFPDIGIPTGTGDCCAPKLLNHAAKNGLRPLGLSEFYYGKENRSGTRKHKQFYPACAEKCQPILGFMLCGTEKWSGGARESRSEGDAIPTIQHSGTPILHYDNDIAVVVKPSGLLSVPGKGPENQDCVTARIKAMFPGCPDHPEVHRLDMDTSGLMVIALNRDAQRGLSRQFHDRETVKKYIALLDGELEDDAGVIKLPFRLDVGNRPMQIYDPVHGKTGITRWRKLGVEDGQTRVEFFPITGRTHQLRVHAASAHGLGVPILGDRLYGTGTAPGQLKLHASFLSFAHPSTGKKMIFRSAPDF